MHLFFSTPIWSSKIENYQVVNNNMLNYIDNLQKKDPDGLIKSNFKGWHSKNFDMKDEEPKKFIEEIKININTAINDMSWDLQTQEVKILNMWAIINKKGNFNIEHTHPNNYLSAAYYVKAPDNCGNFKATNPNILNRHVRAKAEKANELNSNSVSIKINEGDLLIFPAYLPHSVEENKSDEDRVIISFNIDILK